MGIVTLEQNSPEWLAWRLTKVTASEVPIILGDSPYSTAYHLCLQKMGKRPPTNMTKVMERGNIMEPRARAFYEFTQDDMPDFPPACYEHDTLPQYAASLDGYNADLRKILEIKYPGMAEHERVLNKEMPEKYFAQVQHQLFCTGFEDCDFISFREDHANPLAVIALKRDDKYIEKIMLPAINKFYTDFKNGILPALVEADTLDIENDLFHYFFNIKVNGGLGSLKDMRQDIIKVFDTLGHNRVRSHGLTVSKMKKGFRFTTAKRVDL